MVIIVCPHCDTKYNYDESKFEGKPSKKIRCAKCKNVFEIYNPEMEEVPASESAPPPQSGPPPEDPHDETHVTRRPRPVNDEGVTEETGTFVVETDRELPDDIRLSLAITEGPGAAQVYRIEKPSVTIGRTEADVTLNDPESSRHHALLDVRDGHYFLSDMGSRNGTWIEGRQIEGEVEISNQTEFRVGATTLMLIVTSVE